jgi:hypothetical protein
MDAGQVAGLLVLLGVVGVLAAIVGAGLEAGPVKFPSIPRSRQRPLAVVSVLVVAGGAAWWTIQRHASTGEATPEANATARGGLRVLLIPSSGNIRLGQALAVTSTVDDASGQLGTSQCVMSWQDRVAGRVVRSDTTDCDATFRWRSVRPAGFHRVTASVEAMAGAQGSGSGSVGVTVTR